MDNSYLVGAMLYTVSVLIRIFMSISQEFILVTNTVHWHKHGPQFYRGGKRRVDEKSQLHSNDSLISLCIILLEASK